MVYGVTAFNSGLIYITMPIKSAIKYNISPHVLHNVNVLNEEP